MLFFRGNDYRGQNVFHLSQFPRYKRAALAVSTSQTSDAMSCVCARTDCCTGTFYALSGAVAKLRVCASLCVELQTFARQGPSVT